MAVSAPAAASAATRPAGRAADVKVAPPLVAPFSALSGGAPADAARELASRIVETGDSGGLPFAVVDKRAALMLVYGSDGRLAGASSVLLGQTVGDRVSEGVGDRARAGRLRPDDRTTPSGRFASEPGHNLAGEAIVWIHYDSALAIHRLRPGPTRERRAERLASANAGDKRISAGCVVVPAAFYADVVEPLLGHRRGVVYVMPEESRSPPLLQEAALQAM